MLCMSLLREKVINTLQSRLYYILTFLRIIFCRLNIGE